MINFELLKEKTLEDYNRDLNNVIIDLNNLQNYDKNGLLIRILNFDRGWLYGCFRKVLNVSQTSVISNRDELSFFQSLIHFFNYHIYDDGGVCIKYEKYDEKDGDFKECDKDSKRARPFVAYADEFGEHANEKDLLKMLDDVEKTELKRIELIKSFGIDCEPEYKKDYINYMQ